MTRGTTDSTTDSATARMMTDDATPPAPAMAAPIAVRTTGRPPARERRPTLTPEVPLEGETLAGGNSPPRPIMFAAAALAILSIAAAAGARLTGAGHQAVPPTPVEIVRDFRFDDATDGSVVVLARAIEPRAPEREIARLRAGEMMFVRSTVRALGRQRRLDGQPTAAAPFRVRRYRNGRLTLDDPSTGAHLELASFGPTNQAAFEQLLERAR